MTKEITRTDDGEGNFIVQRLKDGALETLKETVVSSGEVQDEHSELTTTETIIITRRIGEKTNF